MASIVEFIDKWLHDGTCTNDTGKDIKICIDGNPGKLRPGETTPPSVDCDGVIHGDNSATKIYGQSGIKEHKSRDWVRDNWPRCYTSQREPGGVRPIIVGSGSGGFNDLDDIPSVHELAISRSPHVAIPLCEFTESLQKLTDAGKLKSFLAQCESSVTAKVLVPEELHELMRSQLDQGHGKKDASNR